MDLEHLLSTDTLLHLRKLCVKEASKISMNERAQFLLLSFVIVPE